ncbi:DUF6931 family protein [Litoribrevibacter euphylliae]|uniref:DUF6931 family protein n=1 Tax=Litoribrevibacter euphylliae TaxID=1834034 RepID=A0ABV7HJB6_9GAMM
MYKKIPLDQSLSILQRYDVSEDCLALINGTMPPAEVIDQLQSAKLDNDLVQFLCHALPVREVIWWACLALELRQQDWTPQQANAITCAKGWVKEPDEAHRRQAEHIVNKIGHDCAPGWLAQAVFWNGSGSITDVGKPAVMPPENLYAKAAAGAINMASVMPAWDGSNEYYQKVIKIGLDLANGGSGNIH